MAEYRLTIRRSAIKEMEHLPSDTIDRVREKIRSLATEPRPSGSTKLKGHQYGWRVRVGTYRILYEIDDQKRVVNIGAIRHRSKAYD